MLRTKFVSTTLYVARLRISVARSSAVAMGIVMALSLTGCAVGPKYQRPTAPVPAQFKESNAPATPDEGTSAIAYNNWWLDAP